MHVKTSYHAAKRYTRLIAFHDLDADIPHCPSNEFKAVMSAYRHRASGTDRQMDGRTAALIYVPLLWGGGLNNVKISTMMGWCSNYM